MYASRRSIARRDCPAATRGQPKRQCTIVWIERKGPFNRGYGRVVLMHKRQVKSELRMCLRQIWIEQYSLARELVC